MGDGLASDGFAQLARTRVSFLILSKGHLGGISKEPFCKKRVRFSMPALAQKGDCQKNGPIAIVLPRDCQAIAK